MRQHGIYMIWCTVTGRVYVGSAVHIPERWRSHRKMLRRGTHHAIKLQRAWDKYGADAFSFDVLEDVADPSLLVPREQFWIDCLRAADPAHGLNTLPTAGSMLGRSPTAETRAKMSAVHKGRPKSPEHRAAIAAAKLGKPMSAEHAAKARANNLGRKFSAEVRAKMSASRKGKSRGPASAETKRKLSEIAKRRVHSPESNEKRRAALKGRPKSEQAKANMAAARAKLPPRFRTDEERLAQSEMLKTMPRDNGRLVARTAA